MPVIKGEQQARYQGTTLPGYKPPGQSLPNLSPARHPTSGGRTSYSQRTAGRGPVYRPPAPGPAGPNYVGRGLHNIVRALSHPDRPGRPFISIDQQGRRHALAQPRSLGGQLGQASGYTQLSPWLAHPLRMAARERAKPAGQRANDAALTLSSLGGLVDAPAAVDASHSLGKGFTQGTNTLLRDERIPKKLRVAVAAASLPIPGPIDNIAQAGLYAYLGVKHRDSLRDASKVGLGAFRQAQVVAGKRRAGQDFSYAMGGSARLNENLRAHLAEIAAGRPSQAEEIVSGSKLGVAHHGTGFPFAPNELRPTGADGDLRVAHLTPDAREALSFARAKAKMLGGIPTMGGPVEAYYGHAHGMGDEGLMSNALTRAIDFSKPDLSHVVRANGEPWFAPRVHSYFVDSRNPIHLEDTPHPGAVELAIERLQNEHLWANSPSDNALRPGMVEPQRPGEQLRGARTNREVLDRIRAMLNPQAKPHARQAILDDIVRKALGADAIITPRNRLMLPSTQNLWDPSIVADATKNAGLRSAAADALRVDAENAAKSGSAGKALDPRQALQIAEAIKAGKLGPLRERILLKHVLESPPGTIKPRYRGTATAYNREQTSFWNDYSLHGPGGYASDSPLVADSYVGTTNNGTNTGNIKMVTHVPGKNGNLDLDRPVGQSDLERIAKAIEGYLGRRGNGIHPDNAQTPKRKAAQFLGRFTPDPHDPHTLGGVPGSEIRDWLGDRYGPTHARRILTKARINTLSHIGGRVIGGLGDHNVSIALKPTRQIPSYRVRGVMQAYQNGIKALEMAVQSHPELAQHRAAYLKRYVETFVRQSERKNDLGGKNVTAPRAIEPRTAITLLRTVKQYPEIKREFGNEAVVAFAKAYQNGEFSEPREMQQLANKLLESVPKPLRDLNGRIPPTEQERYRQSLLDGLRKVLAQRQSDKLDNLYPSGGFPY